MSKVQHKLFNCFSAVVVYLFSSNPALSRPSNCDNIIANPGIPITEETLYGCDWLEAPYGLTIDAVDGVRFTALQNVSIGGENPLGDFVVRDGAEFTVVIKDEWACSDCHLDK